MSAAAALTRGDGPCRRMRLGATRTCRAAARGAHAAFLGPLAGLCARLEPPRLALSPSPPLSLPPTSLSPASLDKHAALIPACPRLPRLPPLCSAYMGKGVLTAVKNVNDIIAPALIGLDPIKQVRFPPSFLLPSYS